MSADPRESPALLITSRHLCRVAITSSRRKLRAGVALSSRRSPLSKGSVATLCSSCRSASVDGVPTRGGLTKVAKWRLVTQLLGLPPLSRSLLASFQIFPDQRTHIFAETHGKRTSFSLRLQMQCRRQCNRNPKETRRGRRVVFVFWDPRAPRLFSCIRCTYIVPNAVVQL